MAKYKCVIKQDFNVLEDDVIRTYKKNEVVRLSKSKKDNWLKNNLIK